MGDCVGVDGRRRERTGISIWDQRGYANVWDYQYAKWFLFGTNKHNSVYSGRFFGVPNPALCNPLRNSVLHPLWNPHFQTMCIQSMCPVGDPATEGYEFI